MRPLLGRIGTSNGPCRAFGTARQVTTAPHIHDGTCASIDPKPRIPLQNVMNGKSTTPLDMPMSAVTKSGINVHKSASDVKTDVACDDLK